MSQLTDADIDRDLTFAIETAAAAGRRVLALRETERWEGKMMADIGDQAADGFLQGFIQGRYPDDGILSEETADSEARLSKERTWIVDPLDGTKEYSQVRTDWAVHVALTVGGQCAIGAVALPSEDDVLWGVTVDGKVAAGSTAGTEFTRGDTPAPDKLRVAVSRSHTPEWIEKFGQEMDAELIPNGSVGFKVSRLLKGAADLYVHKVGLKEWDTCAPETVARAMGWTVCKLRGEEHRYNQANPKNHELVICRPALRDRVLAAVEAAGGLAD